MSKPRLSIIIPVFNTVQFLPECLDSILSQDDFSFDVFLIDDGSDDGSGEVCDEYSRRDSRVRVSHIANNGVSHARNLGLEMADGDYIWFIDSDDKISSDAINKLLLPLQFDPEMIVFGERLMKCDDTCVGAISCPSNDDYRKYGPLVCGDSMYPHCRVFASKLLGDVRFNENLCFLEDRDFVYRLCQHLSQPVYILNESLYEYSVSRCGSAMSTLSLEKETVGLSVHRAILVSELSCGRVMPSYETYIDLCIGVLGRISKERGCIADFDRVRSAMICFDRYSRCLHGFLAIKYHLCKFSPSVFRFAYSLFARK